MIDVPSPGQPDHDPDLQPIRPDANRGFAPEVAPASEPGASVRDELPTSYPSAESTSNDAAVVPAAITDAGAADVGVSDAGAGATGTGGSPTVSSESPVATSDGGSADEPGPLSETTAPVAAAPPEPAPPPPVRSPDLVSDVVRPLPRIMAVANQKGGVGKTTTTVNLGASLAELDHRVLVVDLDPQGNATTGLGINPRTLEYTMYDILLNDVPLDECIEPTEVKGLFVAPASLDLAGAEVELVSTLSRESRLKRALADVIDDYDYVLIDCPPSLGLLTVNALAAATEVLVPIQCEYYALEGLGQLTRNVDLIQRNLNPDLEISAIVLVMYDARTRLGEQVATEVRAHFGTKVCRNVIPRNVRLSEAPSFGKPINTFDPSSRGAVAYRELAREVSGGS